MTTLNELMKDKSFLKNEVSAAVLLTRNSVTGELEAVQTNAGGEIPVTLTGGAATVSVREKVRNVYFSTNVTTSAWVELIASTSAAITDWSLFDSSGQTLEIGVGALGAETRAFIVPQGGLEITHYVASGSRISIKAISATANSGELVLQGVG